MRMTTGGPGSELARTLQLGAGGPIFPGIHAPMDIAVPSVVIVLTSGVTASIVVAALLIVAGVIAASAVINRRRRNTWKQFADRHGLQYDATLPHLSVTGSVGGRSFSLVVSHESSDTGVLGIEDVQMSVALHSSVPQSLEVVAAGGVLGESQKLLEKNVVETGDTDFDAEVLARADDATAALRYLTAGRRHALQKLLAVNPDWRTGLEGQRLYLLDREMGSRLSQLETRLELLCDTADVLDADETSQGTAPSHE